MTVQTKFDIGDRVQVMGVGVVITIGQIRFQTLNGGKILIEYRQRYTTGRYSPWRPENALEVAGWLQGATAAQENFKGEQQ